MPSTPTLLHLRPTLGPSRTPNPAVAKQGSSLILAPSPVTLDKRVNSDKELVLRELTVWEVE